KRWKSLRDTFRRCFNDATSQRGGAGADEGTDCSWPFLDLLLFLRDTMETRASVAAFHFRLTGIPSKAHLTEAIRDGGGADFCPCRKNELHGHQERNLEVRRRSAFTYGDVQEGLEAKVHGEGKPEEAEHGEQLDEGEVDDSGHSDEAGGDAEVDEVNAAEVLTTAVAEDEYREAETILLVYAADNEDLDTDIDNEHQAAAVKAAEAVAAAAVVEATEGAPGGGRAEFKATTPNAVIASKVTMMVSGLAACKALFCGPTAGGTLRESQDKATLAMAAATETTAAAKDKGAVKNSRLAAVRTSQTKAAWPVRPTSAAKSASTAVEAKNDTVEVYVRNYAPGPRWYPASVAEVVVPMSYRVHTPGGRQLRRHVDQMRRRHVDSELAQPSQASNSARPKDSH
ncbi:hypothetical protein MTO96_030677, partial [Rhipicephalus appendiculatus]